MVNDNFALQLETILARMDHLIREARELAGEPGMGDSRDDELDGRTADSDGEPGGVLVLP